MQVTKWSFRISPDMLGCNAQVEKDWDTKINRFICFGVSKGTKFKMRPINSRDENIC